MSVPFKQSESAVLPAVTHNPRRRGSADELRAAAADATTWPDWLQRAVQLTSDALQAPGIFVWESSASGRADHLQGLTFPVEGLADDQRQTLAEIARRAAAAEGVVFGAFRAETIPVVAAIKLPRAAASPVLLVLMGSQDNSRALAGTWLPLLAASAELWSFRYEAPPMKPRTHVVQAPPQATRSRARTVVVAGLMTLTALVTPVPYAVTCDCELQPVIRRFVAAPFEGALEKAFVEVGESVSVGQLLARMDGKEIRWEQAGNAAELERAAKERDAHLADQKFGEAQLAKLQMERLSLTTELLEHRSQNLEIRSPIDGIVVSGELKRAEGVRLSMGQSLFEVAPLDQLLVEVEIPEAELAYVPADAAASIRLEAFPGQKLEGSLRRICPRAELRRKQQVFVGEILLPNESGAFRPGMRGRVSIPAGRATLGWRLFHRAWNKLRLW